MSFEWYSPVAKQDIEVKLSKSGIIFTEAGIKKATDIDASIADANHVKLGWDAQKKLIAVSPTSTDDVAGFKFTKRGKNQLSRSVNAARFYERFGIDPTEINELAQIPVTSYEGLVTVGIPLRGQPVESQSTVDPIRRRRGRRPRVETVAE